MRAVELRVVRAAMLVIDKSMALMPPLRRSRNRHFSTRAAIRGLGPAAAAPSRFPGATTARHFTSETEDFSLGQLVAAWESDGLHNFKNSSAFANILRSPFIFVATSVSYMYLRH